MKTVIEMAREAGLDEWWDSGSEARETFDAHLERLVELVRADAIADEREACAKPDFWEGYVPEPVKPATEESSATQAQQALDKKAENARELGLDYEPAQQEPVSEQPLPCPFCGHVGLDFADGETYRWGVASCGGCGASCGDVRREYPDKGEWHTEAIAEWNKRLPATQRTWQGLTDAQIEKCFAESDGTFVSAARAIEAKLKEKNT